MHFHTAVFFFLSFIAYVKEHTLFLKGGNPPLKLWNTDTASFILAKVDWADDVHPLNLDSIKGFAIFISQARCSSSSVGIDSRRGVRVCWSKRKSDPGTKKSHEENGYYLHWCPNNLIQYSVQWDNLEMLLVSLTCKLLNSQSSWAHLPCPISVNSLSYLNG